MLQGSLFLESFPSLNPKPETAFQGQRWGKNSKPEALAKEEEDLPAEGKLPLLQLDSLLLRV